MAIKEWFKGSAVPSEQLTMATGTLQTVGSLCGNYLGYTTVGVSEMTPKVKTVFIHINLENCPFFMTFFYYHNGAEWIPYQFAYNTNPRVVFPEHLIAK